MEKLNLTPQEVADRYRTTTQVLSNWRVQGKGPRFIKMGRKILYPIGEVVAFEQARLRSNTAA